MNWKLSLVVILESWALVASFFGDDEFPLFPFYLHSEVRKELSEVRVPRMELELHQGNAGNFPTKEVVTSQNQENYEEKGYIKSRSESSVPETSNRPSTKRNKKKNPNPLQYQGFASNFETMEAIISRGVDEDARQLGIYRARQLAGVNCKGVNVKENKFSANPSATEGKARAEIYMDCIKKKYFGQTPLPVEIFLHPRRSIKKEIKTPSMHAFLNQSFKSRS